MRFGNGLCITIDAGQYVVLEGQEMGMSSDSAADINNRVKVRLGQTSLQKCHLAYGLLRIDRTKKEVKPPGCIAIARHMYIP